MTVRFGASVLLAALAIAGCSPSATNLLNTGTVSGQSGTENVATVTVHPTDRALNVAATSSRAQKCGFNFDPEAMKTSYLNYEVSAGLAPDQVAGISRLYDFTSLRIAKQISQDAAYCTSERTNAIKKRLTQYLEGDYTPPPKKAEQPATSWLFDGGAPRKDKINPKWYEKGEKMTVPTE